VILNVKPLSDLTRAGATLSALILVSMLTACGQKGPLYMPKQQPVATKPQPQQSKPAAPADDDTAAPVSK
jgi:predicted small lipoprotein YifL